jgi:hypothetical protein
MFLSFDVKIGTKIYKKIIYLGWSVICELLPSFPKHFKNNFQFNENFHKLCQKIAVDLHILSDEQLKQEEKPGNQQKNVDVDREDKKLTKNCNLRRS